MGDVPCIQITPNDPGDNIASFGAEIKSSTSEPTGVENNHLPSTEQEELELSGGKVVKTRFGRTIRKPLRFRERPQGDIEAQEARRINLVRTKHDDSEAWKKAEKDEIEKFKSMKVYEVCKVPDDVSLIPTRWVYTHKEDDLKGAVFKARCVVKGFKQKEGIHFNKYRVLSPVVELLSIRALTAIATEHQTGIPKCTIVQGRRDLRETAPRIRRKPRILLDAQKVSLRHETIRL